MELEKTSIIERIKFFIADKINEKDHLKRNVYELREENYMLETENEVFIKDISRLHDLLSMQRDFINIVIDKVKKSLIKSTRNRDEEAYNMVKRFDKEGFVSYSTAKELLDINIYDKFIQEDCVGIFEFCDGYGLLKWLEIAAFGDNFTYKIVGHYELIDDYEIDFQSNEYRTYKQAFYDEAIRRIIDSIDILEAQEIIKDGLYI